MKDMVNKLLFRDEAFILNLYKKISEGDGVAHEGLRWVPYTYMELAEEFRCVESTIGNMIRRLCEIGILLKQQLSVDRMDHTNYYTVNSEVVEVLFSASMHRFLGDIYMENINKSNKSKKEKIKDLCGDGCAVRNVIPERTTTAGTVSRSWCKPESSRPKTTTVQDMMRAWHEYFPGSRVRLDGKICRYLVAAFQRKFGNSLNNWRGYLSKISGKVSSLLEAINFYFIDRILGFERSARASLVDFGSREFVEKQISELSELEECKTIRREVLLKHGVVAYSEWMTRVSLRREADAIRVSGFSFVVDQVLLKYLMDYPQCEAGELRHAFQLEERHTVSRNHDQCLRGIGSIVRDLADRVGAPLVA
jgi:predicted transcriptional regulator